MSRRRIHPTASAQHVVYVRWSADKSDGRVAKFYGPFDNLADASGFQEALRLDHPGGIDDSWVEYVIRVERMDIFDALVAGS